MGTGCSRQYDERLHRDFQTANVIDNLRFCCDIVEPAGLTMVIEPLNTMHDHPGLISDRNTPGIPDMQGCEPSGHARS